MSMQFDQRIFLPLLFWPEPLPRFHLAPTLFVFAVQQVFSVAFFFWCHRYGYPLLF